MAAEVIIELIPDISKVESALSQISGEDPAAAKSYKEGNDQLKKQKELLDQSGKAASQAAISIGKMGANTAKVSTEAVKMGNSLKKGIALGVADALNEAGVSTDEFAQALKEAGMSMDQYTQTIEVGLNAMTSLESAEESLRSEKKRLQAEIAQLILAGEQESDMFRQLVARAGEIDDAMGDAADAIKRTGSDTRGIDNAITAATALTAGFTVATSAAALFGDESEETQKILLKVNSAMALLNGIQQIQTILRNEDTKSQIASVSASLKKNVNLAIENGLTSSSVIARKAATAAQWALNAASNAFPVLLLIAGITALIGVFIKFSGATKDAWEEQKKLAEAQKEVFEAAKQQADAMNFINDKRIMYAEKELQAAKARGASNEELYKIESKLAALRQTSAAKTAEYFQSEIKNAGIYQWEIEKLAARQKELAGRTDEQAKKEKEANQARIDYLQNVVDKAKDAQQQYVDAVVSAQEVADEHQRELNKQGLADTKASIEARLASVQKGSEQEMNLRVQSIIAQRNIELNDVNLTQNQRKEIIAKSEREIADIRIEYSKLALEDQKAGIEARLYAAKARSKEEFDYQIQLIQAQERIDLASTELTANQRKAIRAKAEREIADLTKQYNDQQATDSAQIEVLKAQNRVAAFKEGTIEYDNARRQELAAQAALDTLAVKQSTDSEELKTQRILLIQANLNRAYGEITKARFDKEYEESQQHIEALKNLELARLNRKASDPRLSEADQFEAQQNLMLAKLKQVQDEKKKIQDDYNNHRYKSDQEYADAVAKNEEDILQAQQDIQVSQWEFTSKQVSQLISAAFSVVSQASDAYFSTVNANRQARLDADLQSLDDRRQKELDNTNITEAQKAAINKKYDAEERALRKKAAEDEKKAKKAQALINGALAITNIIATRPKFDLGIGDAIMIAAAAATTAIQVAQIDKTPTGYATGTDNASKGWHWVGEKGPELLWFNGGEKVKTHQDSMQYVNSYADRVAGYLPSYDMGDYPSGLDGNVNIDYDKIGKAVAKNMPDQTTHVHVDGIKDIIYSRNSRIEYHGRRKL